MQFLFLLALGATLTFCNLPPTGSETTGEPTTTLDTNNRSERYARLRSNLAQSRQQWQQKYRAAGDENSRKEVLAQVQTEVEATLRQQMIPLWFGTPWDFNGTTPNPGKGEVACGYFVSTLLKHAGWQLNRYKLAQQYSHSIVKSVCEPGSVKRLGPATPTDLLGYLADQPDGLYVVGLDFHVGFMEKTGKSVYFTHSNYIDRKGVERELASQSDALAASEAFVIGRVLPNPNFVRKWLEGETIAIVP